MGFRSAVAGVAKNIVLGAPSTLKNANGFESEDESNTIDLLERVSDSILMEDKLDALNQLRDCMRESRLSHALLAKVGGIDVIFDCLLEEQNDTRKGEEEAQTSEAAHAALEVLVAAVTMEHEEDLKILKERDILEEKGKMKKRTQHYRKENEEDDVNVPRTASELNREAL